MDSILADLFRLYKPWDIFLPPRIYIVKCHSVLMWIQGQEPPLPSIHDTLGKYPQEVGEKKKNNHMPSLTQMHIFHFAATLQISLVFFPCSQFCWKHIENKAHYSNEFHRALKMWLSLDRNPF